MKTANGHEIIQLFESWSPKFYALDDDPIGLQIGQLNRPVQKVLVTLDVTLEVVQEAIDQKCQMILAHHPPIFRPLKNLRTDSPSGEMFALCIKHDIAVYAAHTNLDVAPGGVNDLLAEALGLQEINILEETYAEPMMKLAVYVPTSASEDLRKSLARAGAGKIGNYDSCSFSSTGIGRFQPLEGANPTIGTKNHLEEVNEDKVEVVFPASNKAKVLKAMYTHHPYEEVAFDLWTQDTKTQEQGIGRIGSLEQPMSLDAFAQRVKDRLSVPFVRIVGEAGANIRKVAVLGGDGNKYIQKAKRAGADVLVTGDLYFHVAQDAQALGLNVIDPGHHVESIMKKGVSEKMNGMCKEKKFDCTFVASKISTEPFRIL
ncbi:Nif3-like dinuclear metal center hexameric protein [Paenisporosarcina quisquiliarum]|uniref:GTP cyclohydrolase 1 type 2 homolog n=1 Tax=Paenisporosarcina quisquiliarum TaxID=365346 RepID=A0A9X3LDP7_9BACL|nr:Nif3-like dinuclear metal center hexameric protein [Paenisporosarcina quisquiliarum]MCZ8536051.1 Nif3-like dinuclear metal center hexameric protein [Paenisporosarcina quisquiliarum]